MSVSRTSELAEAPAPDRTLSTTAIRTVRRTAAVGAFASTPAPGAAVADDVTGDNTAKRQSPPSRWWVIHTRARHEKRVAATLCERGVEHYLPLVQTERRYGRRVVRFAVPLFPGYVFVHGDDSALELVWKTNRVANVLSVADQAQLKNELDQIGRVLTNGQTVDLYPRLKAGKRCRITSGPLKGIEGVVVRRRSMSRLYIAVTFIAKSAVIEIDAAVLEAVE